MDPEAEKELFETMDAIGAEVGHDYLAELMRSLTGTVFERDLWVHDPDRQKSARKVMFRWMKARGV